MSIATRARAAILPCASIPSWPTTVLEESPLSQGAPRRGGVWRIEAGPEIREADFGIEPMRSIETMPSIRADGIVNGAQVEQVGDAEQGDAQDTPRGVHRHRAVVHTAEPKARPKPHQLHQKHLAGGERGGGASAG